MNDIITCVDRYKHSPAFGEQVLPYAALLDKPRMGYRAEHVTGAVKHGQEVTIIEKKQAHNDVWLKVSCDVEHEGKLLHQEGWIKRQLLENEGASYFEECNK